jgi:hypothetical protein
MASTHHSPISLKPLPLSLSQKIRIGYNGDPRKDTLMDTKLSAPHLTQITGVIMGEAQKRLADKPATIERLSRALTDRFGSPDLLPSILSADDANLALDVVKEGIRAHEGSLHPSVEFQTINGGTIIRKGKNVNETQTAENLNAENLNAEAPPAEEPVRRRGRPANPDKPPKAPKDPNAAPLNRIDKTKTIVLKVAANPRREGTAGHARLAPLFANPGMTVQQYLDQGGKMNDIHWELEHKRIELM